MVWPLLQSLRSGMSDAVRNALGDEEDRRIRADAAALDPWDALGDGLAAVRGVANEGEGWQPRH
ncbi:hypothetical protein [Blastococcus sp. PRF04-17]|uniref:hypothetical protein n=1 Tax=Blastococcus sp. PRF04-17 TaxID=2933797 RepID=UPI001FF32273|nr:hypothetical protein [Blastococcus sp. PRF04-17]UOY00853.1 hypothetical protein MVA48_17990 [Blastococcus sp. PRF04-17]